MCDRLSLQLVRFLGQQVSWSCIYSYALTKRDAAWVSHVHCIHVSITNVLWTGHWNDLHRNSWSWLAAICPRDWSIDQPNWRGAGKLFVYTLHGLGGHVGFGTSTTKVRRNAWDLTSHIFPDFVKWNYFKLFFPIKVNSKIISTENQSQTSIESPWTEMLKLTTFLSGRQLGRRRQVNRRSSEISISDKSLIFSQNIVGASLTRKIIRFISFRETCWRNTYLLNFVMQRPPKASRRGRVRDLLKRKRLGSRKVWGRVVLNLLTGVTLKLLPCVTGISRLAWQGDVCECCYTVTEILFQNGHQG